MDASHSNRKFSPLQKGVLPKRVLRQGAEAERLYLEFLCKRESQPPKMGRPPKRSSHKRFLAFVGDSTSGVQEQTQRFLDLLGPRVRGNKRWGRIYLYYDLFNQFLLLRRLGVTLPRGNELSAEACRYGLAEILKDHQLTSFTSRALQVSSEKRGVVARRMRRIFERVASVVYKTPVHK